MPSKPIDRLLLAVFSLSETPKPLIRTASLGDSSRSTRVGNFGRQVDILGGEREPQASVQISIAKNRQSPIPFDAPTPPLLTSPNSSADPHPCL